MGNALKKADLPNVDWSQWVQAARKGDRSAQEQLIRHSEKSLYRFCFYLSGHKELAQDLTQEALIRGLEKLGSLDKPDKFVSWLFVIARHLYLDHKKSSQNQEHQELSEAEHLPSGPTGAEREQVLAIRQILSEMTEEERFILISVDVEGLSYLEVSQALGISEEALKSRVYRARQEFAKKVKKA